MTLFRSLRMLLPLLLLTVIASTASAQAVPNLLHLQGRLADAGLVPLNGSYTITVRLYDAPVGGSMLWQETLGVTVLNGVMNTLLGNVSPLPANIFDTPNLHVGIAVETDPEMVPRLRIAAVPFARQAAEAEDVAGRDITPNSVTINAMPVIDPFG